MWSQKEQSNNNLQGSNSEIRPKFDLVGLWAFRKRGIVMEDAIKLIKLIRLLGNEFVDEKRQSFVDWRKFLIIKKK